MEAGKAQAEAMLQLESNMTKLRKEKVDYEEALESLQHDLESMEKENFKLKQNAPAAGADGDLLSLSTSRLLLIIRPVRRCVYASRRRRERRL